MSTSSVTVSTTRVRYRNLPDLWVVLDPESLEAELGEASRYLFRHQ